MVNCQAANYRPTHAVPYYTWPTVSCVIYLVQPITMYV